MGCAILFIIACFWLSFLVDYEFKAKNQKQTICLLLLSLMLIFILSIGVVGIMAPISGYEPGDVHTDLELFDISDEVDNLEDKGAVYVLKNQDSYTFWPNIDKDLSIEPTLITIKETKKGSTYKVSVLESINYTVPKVLIIELQPKRTFWNLAIAGTSKYEYRFLVPIGSTYEVK